MAYKVWTANVDRHNDWTTEAILKDGTTVKMGEPVELSADQVKALVEDGRVIEDSSADKAKQYQESREGFIQPPGSDIAGSAPVFANAGASRFNQESEQDSGTDQSPSPQGRSSQGSSRNE